MRLLKIALIVVLVAVTALFCVTTVTQNLNNRNEAPSITCSSDTLELSVDAGESELLSGVTAADNQDGDLTAEILIAGVSKFTDVENATANVDYLVFDSDGNMGALTRTIRYTDYTAPRFSLTEPLNYKSSENIILLDRLHASDCIDGDITDSIRVSSLDSTTRDEIYALTVQVTNSMGDTREMNLELFWQHDNTDRPVVRLNTCLLYLEQGSAFNPREYVSYADTSTGMVSKSLITIEDTVDTSEAGTYFVYYSYNDGTATGYSILTVVVE